MTKTQIDRLGDKLRQGRVSETDLQLLDQYRMSFAAAYQNVVETIRHRIRLDPTGRAAKSTISIVQKLRRESIRLSQIQDIAGCRLVVSGILEQDRLVKALCELFDEVVVDDRRARPSHAYRAVHLIVTSLGKVVEVQVRTKLQHLWAQLSEKISDLVDPTIKYGGGPEEARIVLQSAARMIDSLEDGERQLFMLSTDLPEGRDQYSEDLGLQIAAIQRTQTRASAKLAGVLTSAIALLKAPEGS